MLVVVVGGEIVSWGEVTHEDEVAHGGDLLGHHLGNDWENTKPKLG